MELNEPYTIYASKEYVNEKVTEVETSYYTPSVNAETGVLSWIASNEDLAALPETNITGPAGYTPVKGTDYYTAADKAEMVNAVLAALPTWTGGSY